jgi:hypothetical protein
MEQLNRLYIQLLHVGFIVVKQAANSGDLDWVRAELEFLHNVPSLLDDPSPGRHCYFWNGERCHFLNWLEAQGSEVAKSRMRTYYMPIFTEMGPIIEQLDSGERKGL